MRKIFTNLKSVVALAVVAAMTLSVSCMYDDTALTKRVDKVEKDLAALTEKVNGLDTEAIESLINGLTVITGVTTDEAGNTVVTLSNGESFTVLAECEGLQYRTENGVLEISADGETWVAVTAAADCLVKEVRTNADGTVTIVFADDTEFTSAVAELIECAATRSAVYVASGAPKAVRFTVNDAVADINVMNQPFGWSATVEEYVAPEEPDYDDDFGVLAVGGTEYVLNITAPSAELVRAGFAAKEGVVSVHFNTASGACKVLKVDVTLAELTLNVDANGNITIVNTLAVEATSYWGETYTDFADFWIGVMPKALYEQNGDKTLVMDYDDEAYDYVNCAATLRGTGLNNILELMPYEEDVYEKEVLEFSVEQLADAFYPTYNFELGESYVIFLALDTEMVGYATHPVLTNAIMAEYTKVLVDAQIVEGSEKWNDVTVNFNLAGFDFYSVGWLNAEEVQMYIDYGMYASADEFIAEYINAYGVMSAGALLYGEHRDATYNLSELAALSMTEWAPELLADTEYYFFVYPFNAKDEMEIYQHEFVVENLRTYGTFATAPLVAGEFETGAAFEVVSHDEGAISVNVTFAEDVKTVIYAWYSSAFLDPEEAAADLLDPYKWDAYSATIDAENPVLNVYKESYYGIDNPIYLVMLAINADGQYVLIQQEFKLEVEEPEAEVIELTSAVAVHADASFIGGTGYDVTFSNGDVTIVFQVQTKDKTYLREGDWNGDFNWAQEGYVNSCQWTGVGLPWPYAMTVAVVDGAYDIVLECLDYENNYAPYAAHFAGQIEGFTLPVAEEEVVLPEFVIPGEGQTFDFDFKYTDLVAGLDENNSLRVCQANGWIWDIKFNTGLTEIVAGDYKATNSSFSSADALEVDTYNGGFQCADYNYIYPDVFEKVTTFNVQKEGDFYCITMIGSGGYGSDGKSYRCVYIGKLQ